MSLGDWLSVSIDYLWFDHEQKGWDKGRWVGICIERVKTVSMGMSVNSFSS